MKVTRSLESALCVSSIVLVSKGYVEHHDLTRGLGWEWHLNGYVYILSKFGLFSDILRVLLLLFVDLLFRLWKC